MNKSQNKVVTRFAPSPTGYLHVGGLRTALYNYLYARKKGGEIVLRIEDTDQSRKVEGAVENLLNTFTTMGLSFDQGPVQGGENGPYFQSQRLEIYRKYVDRLLEDGQAYPCFCTSERLSRMRQERAAKKLSTRYDRHCLNIPAEEARSRMKEETHVIRMKIPEDDVVRFEDRIRGTVKFNTGEIDDQVLVKSDGFPTYHLANVVDDHLMGITHVIRGEEWLTSTPKHVLLYRFLGWDLPEFAHLPLLLNPDRSKLSKRQGDVAVEDYLKKGYLPEALINFVALLGWNPGDDREIFSLSDLEKEFSIRRIQKSGAVFDVEKLNWMNGLYLREMSLQKVIERVKPYFDQKLSPEDLSEPKFHRVIDFARMRVSVLSEIPGESLMFWGELQFTDEDRELLKQDGSRQVFRYWIDHLKTRENWDTDQLKSLAKETADATGVKGRNLYFPLRLALYGSCHGPDIPAIFHILGREESIRRLERALKI